MSEESSGGSHSELPGRHAIFKHDPKTFLQQIYPGLLAALTVGVAATWLSAHYGAPAMLFALLLGMAFKFLSEEGRCVAGIDFASQALLKLGVALLGVRITIDQLQSLGALPVVIVVLGVASTILIGLAVGRLLALSRSFAILSGGSVAICGASAALAISSVLPNTKEREQNTLLTVVAVTSLSTVAMVVYPVIAASLGLDQNQSGLFLGGTIHDVAQVVGAGYSVSTDAGDVATYVKLLRVAMLLPVVLLIAVLVSRRAGASAEGRPPFPGFLLGFAVLVAVSSTGVLPPAIISGVSVISGWCLIAAIAALGMKTSFAQLSSLGWRPVILIVVETIWIAALVLAILLSMGV